MLRCTELPCKVEDDLWVTLDVDWSLFRALHAQCYSAVMYCSPSARDTRRRHLCHVKYPGFVHDSINEYTLSAHAAMDQVIKLSATCWKLADRTRHVIQAKTSSVVALCTAIVNSRCKRLSLYPQHIISLSIQTHPVTSLIFLHYILRLYGSGDSG